jgi:hypothetical protein
MLFRGPQILKYSVLLMILILPASLSCQQVVERGAFGKPAQVMDETGEWTTPLLLVSDKDVQIYIPDISSPAWLKQNYSDYQDRSFYTLSMFTFYKTPEACRINQTDWGLADSQHLNDCAFIGYRVRRAIVNPHEKSVTLLMAAMVDSKGAIQASSVQTERVFRFWNQLDENTQEALTKADALVAEQMKIYDQKLHSIR